MNSLKLASLVALVIASSAFAQETTKESPAAAPAAVNEDGLAPDAAAAELGQAYVGPLNGDWKSRCFKTEDGSDPCEMFQVLTDGVLRSDGSLNTVGEISFFDIPDDGDAVAGAAVILPLETDLQAGVVIAIDEASPKVYPYSFCTQTGCVARLGFTAAEVQEFKMGGKATMFVTPAAAPDQKVSISMSLKGFTAGFDALPQIK